MSSPLGLRHGERRARAALRRSLDLHPLGDWTDDARKLAVFPQDAYPVGGSYAKTRIDTAKGERGFCTESDARSVIAVGGLSRQVDHSTIYRWVQHFAPEMERRLRWQWRWPRSRSWRIDETYVKVRGQWAYLYRALDKLGNTIDFYLSATRNTKAAKRFLGKALNGLEDWEQVTDRDDIRYVYSTFPIVERQETQAYGSYRSLQLCLAWFNALDAGNPQAEITV